LQKSVRRIFLARVEGSPLGAARDSSRRPFLPLTGLDGLAAGDRVRGEATQVNNAHAEPARAARLESIRWKAFWPVRWPPS